MKLFVAIVGSVIIFVGAGLISFLVLTEICPKSLMGIKVNLGFVNGGIPALTAFVIATLAAASSFRASLRYKRKK